MLAFALSGQLWAGPARAAARGAAAARAPHLPADEAVASNLLLHELDFLRRSLGAPAPRG